MRSRLLSDMDEKYTRHQLLIESDIAMRQHNIIHGTGNSAGLLASDVAKYDNMMNLDPLIHYNEKVDANEPSSSHIGLHSPMSSYFTEGMNDIAPQTVHYFEDTDLAKENDTTVALRTAGFASQMGVISTHYGIKNRYDIRGFAPMNDAAETQRQNFIDSETCKNGWCDRMDSGIMNDAYPIKKETNEIEDVARVRDENITASAVSMYRKGSGELPEHLQWYSSLDEHYAAEKKDAAVDSYLLSTKQFPKSVIF